MHHKYYMELAINLARTTQNQTLPNPNVAAIIVKNNKIIATGIHTGAGSDHAEVVAIKQAGNNSHNSTIYVTLEPCSHFGRTPPCVDAIIKAGISTVVCAMTDPNSLVNNSGIEKLRQHNIEVITDVLKDEAVAINQVYLHNIQHNLPYVTLKAGLSLDGKIACHTGISKWITTAESRYDAHTERAKHTAIMVGVGTVLADNPKLTPHLLENTAHQPIRIILDSQLKTPLTAQVIQDNSTRTFIVSLNDTDKYQDYSHVKTIKVAKMEPLAILESLYQHEIYSIFIEGGSLVYTSFLEANLVNQLILYYSPQLIGGEKAKSLFSGNGFTDLYSNPKYKILEHKIINGDLKLTLARKSHV